MELTVSEHIANLLEHHECVIIPDFGGFLVKNSSATYSQEKLSFYPPSAVTQFHIHLRNNDGLLIQSIMEEETCSYNQAAQKVTDFIKERKEQLKETKSTILPGVGKIYLDEEDKVLFKPNRETNFNQESFGLEPIVAERINRVEQVEQQVVQEIRKRKRNPIALAFTAAASILALVLATSLFFLHNGNASQQEFVRASFGDILKPVADKMVENESEKPYKTATDEPSVKEEIETATINTEEVTTISSDSESEETAEQTTLDTEIKKESNTPILKTVNESVKETVAIPTVLPKEADFRVVIGMFEDEANAQNRYQEALAKGYENVQLKHGRKYHRVVVPYSLKDATWKEAVAEIKTTIEPEAWIWETLYQ